MILLKNGQMFIAPVRINELVLIPVLVFIFLLIMIYQVRKHRINIAHQAFIFILFAYIYFLVGVTIFPINIFGNNSKIYLNGFGLAVSQANLNPLAVGDYGLIQIVGNLLLFVPLGFIGALLYKRFNTLLANTRLCFVTSLMIELIQLMGCYFYLSDWSFDVVDIILNTLGGLIGFVLFRLLRKLLGEKLLHVQM